MTGSGEDVSSLLGIEMWMIVVVKNQQDLESSFFRLESLPSMFTGQWRPSYGLLHQFETSANGPKGG